MASDRELWDCIRQGDVRAFDDFYHENAPSLHGFLKQLVGEASAAEDVVQETFMRLWRQPNGFHPEKGSLRAYLFGIGRKQAAEWWRKQGSSMRAWASSSGRQTEASPHAHSDEPASPAKSRASAVVEMPSLMRDALSRIKREHRELLWLREAEGLSYEELAAILNVPLGTVRSRLSTAREELRRVWRGEDVAKRNEVDV